MQLDKLLFSLSLITLLISCKRLPVYNAHWKSDRFSSYEIKGHYDADSRVIYRVQYDVGNLYIRLSTSDQSSQLKILKSGFTIWFDDDGKQKTKRGIEFPLKQNNLRKGSKKSDRSKTGISPFSKEHISSSLKLYTDYQEQPKKMALLGFNGNQSREEIHFASNSSKISIDVVMDSLGTLFYTAQIPISMIFPDSESKNQSLSIGLKSGDFRQIPPKNPEKSENSQQRGRSGSARGGKPGGRGQRGANEDGNYSSTNSRKPIEIWFKVNLIPKGA